MEVNLNNSESIIGVTQVKPNDGYNINLMIKKIFTYGNYESIVVETDNPTTGKNDSGWGINSKKKFGFGPMINHRQITQPSSPLEEQNIDMIALKTQRESKRGYMYKRQTQSIQETQFKIDEISLKLQQADVIVSEQKYNIATSLYQKVSFESLQMIKNNYLSVEQKQSCLLMGVKADCMEAQCHSKTGQYKHALHCLKKCLRDYEINEPDTKSKIFLQIGHQYFELKWYNQSLDFFVEALKIFEALNWQVNIGTTMCKIALIYALYDLFTEAKRMAYYSRDLLMKKLSPSDLRIADAQYTLGAIHFFSQEYNFSIEHYKKAYDICLRHPKEKFLMMRTLNGLGTTQLAMGWPTHAANSYKEALKLAGEEESVQKGQIQNNLGVALIESNDFLNGHNSFKTALNTYGLYHKPIHHQIQRTNINMNFLKKANQQNDTDTQTNQKYLEKSLRCKRLHQSI